MYNRLFMTTKQQIPKNIRMFQNLNGSYYSKLSKNSSSLLSLKNGKLIENNNIKLMKWLNKTTKIKEQIYDNMIVFIKLLQIQMNIYLSLQLRRIAQICHLYRRLYSPSELQILLENLKFFKSIRMNEFNLKKYFIQRMFILSSAVCCSTFNWNEERINDDEFEELIKDFIQNYEQNQLDKNLQNPQPQQQQCELTNEPDDDQSSSSFMAVNCMKATDINTTVITEWEEIIRRPNFYVLRKSIDNSTLYQYKVFGSFDDISAYSFYAVQKDLDYRKKWDKLVIKLDIIDVEESSSSLLGKNSRSNRKLYDSGNELIHWIMKYPYPMMNREYLYIRRSIVDFHRNFIVLISRSVRNSSNIIESNEQVRVYDYMSQMVIKPHKTFDKPGFEFMLTYFDDPRASFPSPAYAWMAARGVPDFVEKLHQVALKFADEKPLENILQHMICDDDDDDCGDYDDDDDNVGGDDDDNNQSVMTTKDVNNRKNFLSLLPEPVVDFDSLIWN
uniref:Phosphatidylcholine transfer protein n=1 Tax=Dermatophagoides pteronyssinus TaxID=6956 RepID=A0A6P6Y8Y6_DERPT|nr:stAR-related lipid transfer protein 7, mitochondrial-like [Dermatophagoides pteronyssinus]